jgi:hypothetical protein
MNKAPAMERYLLFIRDVGTADQTDIHPSESEARKALAAYVRRRSGKTSLTVLLDDEEAIDAYFANDGADYVIARVRKPAPRAGLVS